MVFIFTVVAVKILMFVTTKLSEESRLPATNLPNVTSKSPLESSKPVYSSRPPSYRVDDINGGMAMD